MLTFIMFLIAKQTSNDLIFSGQMQCHSFKETLAKPGVILNPYKQ